MIGLTLKQMVEFGQHQYELKSTGKEKETKILNLDVMGFQQEYYEQHGKLPSDNEVKEFKLKSAEVTDDE